MSLSTLENITFEHKEIIEDSNPSYVGMGSVAEGNILSIMGTYSTLTLLVNLAVKELGNFQKSSSLF